MSKVRVSFDFDGTISGTDGHIEHVCQILRNHILLGDEVVILTARNPAHDEEDWWIINCPARIILTPYMESLGLSHLPIVYTSHELKGPYAKRLGVAIHYDNDPNEIRSCREHDVVAVPIGGEHHDPTLHNSYRHYAQAVELIEHGTLDFMAGKTPKQDDTYENMGLC